MIDLILLKKTIFFWFFERKKISTFLIARNLHQQFKKKSIAQLQRGSDKNIINDILLETNILVNLDILADSNEISGACRPLNPLNIMIFSHNFVVYAPYVSFSWSFYHTFMTL